MADRSFYSFEMRGLTTGLRRHSRSATSGTSMQVGGGRRLYQEIDDVRKSDVVNTWHGVGCHTETNLGTLGPTVCDSATDLRQHTQLYRCVVIGLEAS